MFEFVGSQAIPEIYLMSKMSMNGWKKCEINATIQTTLLQSNLNSNSNNNIIDGATQNSTNGCDRTQVNVKQTTVKELKNQVFGQFIDQGQVVRFIYMGKMMQDPDLIEKYNVKQMSFIHVFIANALNRPEGARPADGEIETTDGKTGFDRFLRMSNKQYTDLQVHQMRLALHAILMRSGVEKTDETADGLLANEERWLKNELENDAPLIDLIQHKSVLSCRNDIVLPVYQDELDNVNDKFSSKD